jgi:hypothetical protein
MADPVLFIFRHSSAISTMMIDESPDRNKILGGPSFNLDVVDLDPTYLSILTYSSGFSKNTGT